MYPPNLVSFPIFSFSSSPFPPPSLTSLPPFPPHLLAFSFFLLTPPFPPHLFPLYFLFFPSCHTPFTSTSTSLVSLPLISPCPLFSFLFFPLPKPPFPSLFATPPSLYPNQTTNKYLPKPYCPSALVL